MSAPSKPPESGGSGPSLRDALRDTPPSDFSLKAAWPQLIRALRATKRATGHAPRLGSRTAVEQALGSPLPARSDKVDRLLGEVKTALRQLVVGVGTEGRRGSPSPPGDQGAQALAARVDDALSSLLASPVEGRVPVRVGGWPPGFDEAHRARLLRRSTGGPFQLPADEAAAVVREFDGFVLGGSRLRVEVDLPGASVLPSVPRALRARPALRDQAGPWLPHVDEVGRRSMTPRALAQRQAERIETRGVLDGCCGCGGNAVAFALAGLDVVAVEIVPERLDLARENARHEGVEDRIRFVAGDLCQLLPALLHGADSTTLFLDPPWAGSLDGEDPPRWPDLIPGGAALAALLPPDLPLLAKLPRSFDVGSLPGASWEFFYDFGEGSMASVVRMIGARARAGTGAAGDWALICPDGSGI